MKKIMLPALLFVIAFISNATGQNKIMIEYTLSTDKGISGNIKGYFSTLGSRLEIQMNTLQKTNSKIIILKQASSAMAYMLDEKNKTYIGTSTASNTKADSNATIKIIGKEKTGNYNCTHVIVMKGIKSFDYWFTTEIKDYEKYNNAINNSNKYIRINSDYATLLKNGISGFVVKCIGKNARKTDFEMELVKIENKNIDDALFEIPSDYKATIITSEEQGAKEKQKLLEKDVEEMKKKREELNKQSPK